MLRVATTITPPDLDDPFRKQARTVNAREHLVAVGVELKRFCTAAELVSWRDTHGRDDILDAYAGLWSACRFARRPAGCRELGAGERDDSCVLMRMVV